MLDMHVETMIVEAITEKHESFLDFLSKVGGWMGLFVGASMVSFVELIYFAYLLVRVPFK